jgi:cytosine/adenosine deaminase-related metal-dependent hydrolase
MFEEARTAALRSHEPDNGVGEVRPAELLRGGQRMVSELFGERIGTLEKGAAADVIVLGYIPPTPLSADTLGAHFLYGMRSSMVESVMVNGEWVMKEREFPRLDVEKVSRESAKAAARLWKRMAKQ